MGKSSAYGQEGRNASLVTASTNRDVADTALTGSFALEIIGEVM